MMDRIPEPELMDDPGQAQAYACADFSEANNLFCQHFERLVTAGKMPGRVLDLGCGPGDIVLALAERYPDLRIDAVDGSDAMLNFARKHLGDKPELAERVKFVCGVLPGAALPHVLYDCVTSNSLLHHLHDPFVLWRAVKEVAAPGAAILIMDLARPTNSQTAKTLVDTYASGEPEVLRTDFYNSLCAAFTPEEVSLQLLQSGLGELEVSTISDRHLLVAGHIT